MHYSRVVTHPGLRSSRRQTGIYEEIQENDVDSSGVAHVEGEEEGVIYEETVARGRGEEKRDEGVQEAIEAWIDSGRKKRRYIK